MFIFFKFSIFFLNSVELEGLSLNHNGKVRNAQYISKLRAAQ
jgi:hypothetical protein